MGITVTRTGPDFADQVLSDKELMRQIGLLARERILRRTAQGIDMTGAPFRPYSVAYLAQKLNPRVNLQVSGAMLQAIGILDVTETSVTIGYQ
jgi:hypothetical protein